MRHDVQRNQQIRLYLSPFALDWCKVLTASGKFYGRIHFHKSVQSINLWHSNYKLDSCAARAFWNRRIGMLCYDSIGKKRVQKSLARRSGDSLSGSLRRRSTTTNNHSNSTAPRNGGISVGSRDTQIRHTVWINYDNVGQRKSGNQCKLFYLSRNFWNNESDFFIHKKTFKFVF